MCAGVEEGRPVVAGLLARVNTRDREEGEDV